MPSKSSRRLVTLISGDGIGPEVMKAATAVFAAAEVPIDWDEQRAGAEVFRKGVASGVLPETIASLRKTKLALKGPLETPVGYGQKSANVTLRKYFETYGNIRPVREIPGIRTPYSGRGIDFVVVRENVEDLYAGIEYMPTPTVAEALKLISRRGSENICRLAFELARAEGRKKVTCATKANILKMTEGLFKTVFEEVAKNYPEIAAEHHIVDNCAHQMVMRPEQFDVLVMTNMNGDILSDLASALIGGLGFAPSANLGSHCAIFEAVHGSAPQIAGKGVANPTAIISSAVMLLRHIGELKSAETIEQALLVTLEEGKSLTPDVSHDRDPGSTESFTKQIIANLGRAPKLFPLRSHSKIKMPELAANPAHKPSSVRGVDVYVQSSERPESLAKKIVAGLGSLTLRLKQISNRGTKVWPNELGLDIDIIDSQRLRLMPEKDGTTVADADIAAALSAIAQTAPWVHVEKLLSHDGKIAFSKDQGED